MSKIIDEIKSKIEDVSPEKIIMLSSKIPLTKINREKFLKKEFIGKYSEDVIHKAIEYNPAYAGIGKDEIEKLALKCIAYETNKVSAISFAAGLPGGLSMIGTIPADIAQFYAFIIRIMQKLSYLYGFPEFDFDEENLSDSTMNEILTFLGVMFGVQEASTALKILSANLVRVINQKLARKAIMATTWYPLLRRISAQLGIRMSRRLLTESISKVGIVVGGFVCGGLTFASFRTCSIRLKDSFKELNLCDPKTYDH